MFLAMCAIVGWGGFLQAQVWQQETNVFGPDSIVTTGGITYAEYSWAVGGCDSMSSVGPLIRNGGDFSFDFDYEMETGVPCAANVYAQSATVVFGVLTPGIYALTTTSWGEPVGITNFIVPPMSTPTLQPGGFSTNGSFEIKLNGVANVAYVLQSSTDLVNWTSLSTNSIGPPLTDPAPALTGWRYYRVQIPQRVTIGPGLPIMAIWRPLPSTGK